jgi:dipeptidyl aminopeptidase/acylaminoacyl peptidase
MRGVFNRRQFLAAASTLVAYSQEKITFPAVSEQACPLMPIRPVAKDGHRGKGILRKPTGSGPFPAILWIHGGLAAQRTEELQSYARGPNPSRLLAAGYVVIIPTYRSRDVDPQSTVSLQDCLAVVDYAKRLDYVDPKSIVVYGCSGGGDLALEIAAAAEVCAIIPEEPASLLMAGILNAKFPKQGRRYTGDEAGPIMENPKQYYTPECRKILQAKIARIRCPILILQGDEDRREVPINKFNAQVLVPELRAAGKTLEVITYPGERHCFCFEGTGDLAPRPSAVLKAFQDMDAFCRRYVSTKPKPLEAGLIEQTPL